MHKALPFPGNKGSLSKAGPEDDDSGCSQWPRVHE